MTRRNFFSHVLAAVTGAPTPQAEPALSNVLALIAALDAATKAQQAAAEGRDLEIAADDRSRIVEDLLGQHPATIRELHAKVQALTPIFLDDAETLLWAVAEDIRVLAGEGE